MLGSLSDGFESKKGRGERQYEKPHPTASFCCFGSGKNRCKEVFGAGKGEEKRQTKNGFEPPPFLCRERNFSGRLDSREKLCYNGAEKQSRASCVKCRLNRELSGGRKAGFGLRCGARIPLLHNTGVLPPGRDPPDVMRHSSDAVS